jgi:hypothetical protein
MADEKPEPGGVSRLSFIKASAGVAAGAAAIGVPAAIRSEERGSAVAKPASAAPQEPVMAYVHDARRYEVTVMWGERERTYRDPALVKRLLAAAPKDSPRKGGDSDVIAS